jgi:hypothetical protein
MIPVIISIPATIMCGINKTFKTNFDGEITEINLCETDEIYKSSKWRIIYKFALLISQLGISVVYIVLYTFVMKEAWKQVLFEKSRLTSTFNQTQIEDSKQTVKCDIMKATQDISQDDNIGELLNKMRSVEEPNVLIIDTVHKKTDKIKGTNRLMSKQSQLSVLSQQAKFPAKTLVWFVLTLIFIVTFMTHLGLTFKVTKTVAMSTNELFWFLLFYRLYFINHIINPVVYATFLKNFRSSCRRLLTTKCN